MDNDRMKNQDETDNNDEERTPIGGEDRPGQSKQTQGDPSRGKQFEGGREGSGSSSERGTSQQKDARSGEKSKSETGNDEQE